MRQEKEQGFIRGRTMVREREQRKSEIGMSKDYSKNEKRLIRETDQRWPGCPQLELFCCESSFGGWLDGW